MARRRRRSAYPDTEDIPLWEVIKGRRLPFPDIESYRLHNVVAVVSYVVVIAVIVRLVRWWQAGLRE